MNWVDIVIIVSVLLSAFMGWRNGVIRWAITLVGAAIGIIVAGRTYESFSSALTFTDNETFQSAAAYAIVFLAFVIAAWFIARFVKGMMKVLFLGWVDNLAGLVVGAVVGLLGASTLISLMGILPSASLQEAVVESSLAEQVVDSTGFVRALLPVEFDEIKDLFDRAKDIIPSS